MSDKIFDLEQEIMQCWNVVDDIQLVMESGGNTHENMDALAKVYSLKFQKCWNTFESVCREYHKRGKADTDAFDTDKFDEA